MGLIDTVVDEVTGAEGSSSARFEKWAKVMLIVTVVTSVFTALTTLFTYVGNKTKRK